MWLKRLFNIILYSFFMIVPLMPLKVKVSFIPVSADFILGGLAIVVGLIYACIAFFKNKKAFDIFKDRKVIFLTISIIVFVVISLVSTLYAVNKPAAVAETIRFLEYAAIFYLILLISDDQFIKKGLILFYIVMIFASLFGIIQFAFNLSGFHDVGVPFGRGRIYSTFENPNYWGAAVNLVIFVPIIDLIEGKMFNKLYDYIAIIIFMFNLILSFTRGSWVGFALGIVTLFAIRYRKALISVPCGIAVLLAVPSTRGRIFSIFNPDNLTNMERLKLWKTGLIMFKDHFWTGVGNGNYLYRYKEYIIKYRDLYLGRNQFSVHNSFIKMFAELGIFGGISFILIYASLAYIIYKSYKYSKKYKLYILAFIAFLITYYFQNLFNNLMFIPQLNVFVWIIAAMLFKGTYIEKQGE